MKNTKKLFVAFLVVCITISCAALAFANQENGIDIPHTHEYQVVHFEDGIVTCECKICKETKYERFDSHINEWDYELLDMNGDEIVNAKDFAILVKNYSY